MTVEHRKKNGRHIAGIVEMNKLIYYALDPANPSATTVDGRKAHNFKSEGAATDWCQHNAPFSYIYAWSVGS